MSSAIIDIYSAISQFNVNTSGKTIKVRDIDEVRDTFEPGDAPTRMMLTITGLTEQQNAAFISLGKIQSITWRLEDRLYWRPLEHGQGLLDWNDDLIKYIRNYAEAVRDNRSLTTQSHITDVRCIPAVVRWPDIETGTPYAGVRCIVTIEEVISGA